MVSSSPTPPVVSVGVPVFNEEKYLGECLDSLIAQTYPRIEVLVSDNASTDRTWDVVQERAALDPRVSAVRMHANIGARANFGATLHRASGRYFMWAGGHDRWGQDALSRCVDILEGQPGTVLAVPQTKWIDAQGQEVAVRSEMLDTRAGRSACGRALLMFQQMVRCSALYGLHRRDVLTDEFARMPSFVNADFMLLMRIAARGDVVTAAHACWFRRVAERHLSPEENSRRHCEIYGVRGLAARFPLAASRLRTLGLFCRFPGRTRDRIALLKYALWRHFLARPQPQILLREFRSGLRRRSRLGL
jgi:glycosyltransferase involved in cell wall biosynthesis